MKKKLLVFYLVLLSFSISANDNIIPKRIKSKKEKIQKTLIVKSKKCLIKNSNVLMNTNKEENLNACRINVHSELDGVTIDGTVTIEGISGLSCLGLKVLDFFSKRF